MIIPRQKYLNELIDLRHNGMIKIVTGIRRSGKSFLLFELFSTWLANQGVRNDHIIKIDLENLRNSELRDPRLLLEFIDSRIIDDEMHYVLIDEVQMVRDFQDVLVSYLKIHNVDVYVTGSNARFLSKDIVTNFRGRGFEIKVYPLSFSEFYPACNARSIVSAYNDYSLYGGLPQILLLPSDELKVRYLKDLYNETYIRDIRERYNIRNDEELDNLITILASSIGSFVNPTNLTNAMKTVLKSSLSRPTIVKYLDYIKDAFLVEQVQRYDVKGKRYLDTQSKYYFTDLGLRNARLNFRQNEPTHIMENIIFNELLYRGFNVDVGQVSVVRRDESGVQSRATYEVDFVCNKGSQRYYIQSAYRLPTEEKIEQEERSLRHINDSFKKIIIVGHEQKPRHNEYGITTIGLFDFLINPDSLDF